MTDVAVSVPSTGTAPMRARSRAISATTYYEQYMIQQAERVVSAKRFAASQRIPNRAVTSQKIAVLQNNSATNLVAVKAVIVDIETAVASVVLSPYLSLIRGTGSPTGGSTFLDVKTDSADTADSQVFCWSDASVDGTNSTTALAHTATGNGSRRFIPRLNTLVGESPSAAGPADMLRDMVIDEAGKPVILRNNQVLVLQLDAAAAMTAAVFQLMVTFIWEDFLLP